MQAANTSRSRPILFSAPMVRAIIAGAKSQTRRVVKPVGSDGSFVLQDYGNGWWPFRSDDGSERLSDWELGFVDSLQRQLADGRRPSAKQIDTLDTIWERATKRG